VPGSVPPTTTSRSTTTSRLILCSGVSIKDGNYCEIRQSAPYTLAICRTWSPNFNSRPPMLPIRLQSGAHQWKSASRRAVVPYPYVAPPTCSRGSKCTISRLSLTSSRQVCSTGLSHGGLRLFRQVPRSLEQVPRAARLRSDCRCERQVLRAAYLRRSGLHESKKVRAMV
jgi:hypothetical protein